MRKKTSAWRLIFRQVIPVSDISVTPTTMNLAGGAANNYWTVEPANATNKMLLGHQTI